MSDSIADQFAADAQSAQAAEQPVSISQQFASDSGAGSGSVPGAPAFTTGQNFAAGIGHGMVTTAANIKQGFDKAANYIEQTSPIKSAIQWANGKLGLPNADEILQNTNNFIAENHKYGDSVTNTTAGKVGNFVGNTASALPATLVPGANTYLGSALIGGVTGLATTEGGLSDRLTGAESGAVGGVLGKYVGDTVGAGVSKLSDMIKNSAAAQQAGNYLKDSAINLAQKYGYKLAPQDVNPTALNATLQGLSGKIKTQQAASQANQTITNSIVKKELGIPDQVPLTADALKTVRAQAGQAYNVVRGSGTITPGDAYTSALDNILAQSNGQAKSFPGLKNDDITSVISTLKQPTFDAGDAVDATHFLRNLADKAYGSNDNATGAAYKQASTALEDAIDQHMQSLGNPDALNQFRQARQTMAQTYTVGKALNPVTGNVDAGKLATQLQRGKPLSGGLQDVAQIASQFPKATQVLKEDYNAISPLDYATAAAGAVGKGNALTGLLTLGARPVARSTIMSDWMQGLNAKAATDYSGGIFPNAIAPMLTSRPLSDLLRVGGTVGAIESSKK